MTMKGIEIGLLLALAGAIFIYVEFRIGRKK